MMCISGTAEYFLIGFATFIPKIIQFQMGQTPAMAAIILGMGMKISSDMEKGISKVFIMLMSSLGDKLE